MAAASRRISVGFKGGQVLALRVNDEQLKSLNKALGDPGWHEVESDEGPVRLDLAQVSTSAPRARSCASASGRGRADAIRVLGRCASTRLLCPEGASCLLAIDRLASRLNRKRLCGGPHRAHTPATRHRAVLGLGEHGGVWLAIGVAGQSHKPQRTGWRRATRRWRACMC